MQDSKTNRRKKRTEIKKKKKKGTLQNFNTQLDSYTHLPAAPALSFPTTMLCCKIKLNTKVKVYCCCSMNRCI